MARYYLVPIETDPNRDYEVQPKYLKEIRSDIEGSCSIDVNNKPYYILRILNDSADLSGFIAHSDVINLSTWLNKANLQSLGIVISGNSNRLNLERLLNQWLTGRSVTLGEL